MAAICNRVEIRLKQHPADGEKRSVFYSTFRRNKSMMLGNRPFIGGAVAMVRHMPVGAVASAIAGFEASLSTGYTAVTRNRFTLGKSGNRPRLVRTAS